MEKELSHQLALLADKLNISLSHLWVVLVRQAYIDGIRNLILYALLGGVTGLYWKNVIRYDKRVEDNSDDDGGAYACGLFSLILAWLVAALFVGDTLTCFVNPEYHALTGLLDTLRSK